MSDVDLCSGLITSIVRFATFYETNEQIDPTWSSVKLGCISIAEAGVYLLAACLPTFRSLFRTVRTRVGLSTHDSRGTGQYTDPQLLSGQSKQGNVYGDSSLHGFERLEYEERGSKDTSSVELNNYEPGKHIRVKQDFVISTARR